MPARSHVWCRACTAGVHSGLRRRGTAARPRPVGRVPHVASATPSGIRHGPGAGARRGGGDGVEPEGAAAARHTRPAARRRGTVAWHYADPADAGAAALDHRPDPPCPRWYRYGNRYQARRYARATKGVVTGLVFKSFKALRFGSYLLKLEGILTGAGMISRRSISKSPRP